MSTGQASARVSEVARAIHLVTEGSANIYLIEDGGGLTLVDAGTAHEWGLLQHGLMLLGRTLNDLKAVLLTHAHVGHPGYAERGRAHTGVRLWAHDADAEVVRADFYQTLLPLLRRGRANSAPVMDISAFADGETLDAPGRPRAVHAPGHTPGNTAILLEDRRVLLSGHTLVTQDPLSGRPGPQIMPASFNQDSRQALRSLGVLEGLPADVVLPGYGEPWTAGVGEAVRQARAGRASR